MNSSKATGLGEPEVVGKKSLFQAPPKTHKRMDKLVEKPPQKVERRVRMTLEISMKSLSIIQETQSKYRLDTRQSLPKWKIIDEALELYAKMKRGEESEAQTPDQS